MIPVKANEIISEGRSNAYLVHACFLLAFSFAMCYFSVWFLVLAIPAIALFTATTGVEIESIQNRVRKYSSVLGIRWGVWLPLKFFIGVELMDSLVYHSHSSFFKYNKSSARTFDVLLISEKAENYQINDFFEYEKAKSCLEALAANLSVVGIDHYANETAALQAKGRRR